MIDRHELNQDIMGCQGILDDLRMLTWRLDDTRNLMDPESVADVIRGLETLYDIKFRKVWETYNDTFEEL